MPKRSSQNQIKLSLLAVFVMAFITVASVFVYRILINRTVKTDVAGNNYYTYHFAMVVEARGDPFWKNVWRAANEAAEKEDACVEWIGETLAEEYPLTTLMRMAIAAGVDGILVQPDGSYEMNELIRQAIDEGIPVITVLTDSIESARQGFVGYNTYELGQLYGQQLLAALPQNDSGCRVVVLFSNGESETAQNIVYSCLMESLSGKPVTLDVVTIDNSSVFSAEEAIRELVVSSSADTPAPDILICLNATNTICAYQAVVDHNKVGRIQILGCYDSDEILTAVEKNIVQATIAVDANRIGEACVDALMEYLRFERTSDYTTVGLSVITTENVAEYAARGDAAQEGE